MTDDLRKAAELARKPCLGADPVAAIVDVADESGEAFACGRVGNELQPNGELLHVIRNIKAARKILKSAATHKGEA